MMSLTRRKGLAGVASLSATAIALGAILLGAILLQPAGAEQEAQKSGDPAGADSVLQNVSQQNDTVAAASRAGGAPAAGEKAKEQQEGFVFRVFRDKDQLRLRGAIPSAADQKMVIGMVKASFPGVSVSEKMRVDEHGPDREVWLGGVSFALRQLAMLDTGVAVLQNTELSLQGVAGSTEKYAAVQSALSSEVPRGVELKGASITPPSVRPFTWFAKLHHGGVALSGHVPGGGEQEALNTLAGELFPENPVVSAMEVAAGEPVGWGSAVRQSLRVLSQLESGALTVSDLAVKIEGVAADEARMKVAQDLGRSLPAGFAVENCVKLAAGGVKKAEEGGVKATP